MAKHATLSRLVHLDVYNQASVESIIDYIWQKEEAEQSAILISQVLNKCIEAKSLRNFR